MFRALIKRYGWVRIATGALCIALFLAFVFRKSIKEHKVTRAKVEMMKRMTDTPIENWPEEFKNIYDSLIVEDFDTTIQTISETEEN